MLRSQRAMQQVGDLQHSTEPERNAQHGGLLQARQRPRAATHRALLLLRSFRLVAQPEQVLIHDPLLFPFSAPNRTGAALSSSEIMGENGENRSDAGHKGGIFLALV